MAIKKEKTVRGIKADYWKIVDCDVKRGVVCLALYLNKEHAQVRENMIDGRTRFDIEFPVDVSKPLEYAYAKIKESLQEDRIVQEATEEQEAITELVETNWFADAEDV